MPTLYIVPTPIGNLEDITLRALRILKEVALIAAEDTRTSRILLQHYQITTPLTSYHEHNKLTKLDALFETLGTQDVALISDAGTPGLSDPGYELIAAAIAQGIRVEVLPGPNALLPALVGSGLPTDGFVFLGFLPRKAKALQELFYSLAGERRTLVAYESPNRLVETLSILEATLGERAVCVAREISKKFETFQRGTVDVVRHHFEQEAPRGEIVLVIGGVAAVPLLEWTEAQVRMALATQLEAGDSLSRAAKVVAERSGWNKRDVYALGTDMEA
jgi:16S rRNA (cytidine1402-2'-O)-methyltransferase